MKRHLIAVAVMVALTAPASAQVTAQQQRMKDCNTQASGMTGDARKQFMSSCLSGPAAERKGLTAPRGNRAGIPASPKTRFATNESGVGQRKPDVAWLVRDVTMHQANRLNTTGCLIYR